MTEAIEVEAKVLEPSTDIEVKYTEAKLAADFSSLEKYVDEKLKLYEGMVIDPENEDQVKAARGVCADMNNLAKPIDERRKEIKREYEKPLKAFEAEVKTITSKIASAREKISKQVDAADALYKQNKRAGLEEYYVGVAGEDLGKLIQYEKLHDDKWLNRSVTTKKAEDALFEKVQRIISDLNTLKSTPLDYMDEAKEKYYETVDLQASLRENQRLIELAKERASRKAAEMNVGIAAQPKEPVQPPQPAKKDVEHELSDYALILRGISGFDAQEIAKFAEATIGKRPGLKNKDWMERVGA